MRRISAAGIVRLTWLLRTLPQPYETFGQDNLSCDAGSRRRMDLLLRYGGWVISRNSTNTG